MRWVGDLLKWEAVAPQEYLEITTERLQYHKGPGWLTSAGRVAGTKDKPWRAEIEVDRKWRFVGEFRTAREAKQAAIDSFKSVIA